MIKISQEILQLQEKIKELEQQLTFKNEIVALLNESIPETQNERKKYMGDVALFYSSIFKNKLKHFITQQLEELAQIGRTELSTNIIRANINVFRLIDEWMEERTNEHIGNIEQIRRSFDNEDDFINNMKKTYGDN